MRHAILVKSEKPYAGGIIFTLDTCPFFSAHQGGAYAIQFANGAIFACCHHTSCGGGMQRWQELHARFKPSYRNALKTLIQQATSVGGQRPEPRDMQKKPVAIDGDKLPADLSKQCQPVQDSPTGSAPSYALTDAGTAEPADRTVWRHRPLRTAFNSWFLWNGKIWERTMWAGVHMCHGVRPVHRTRSGAGRVNWTDPGAHPYLWTWFTIHGETQVIILGTIEI